MTSSPGLAILDALPEDVLFYTFTFISLHDILKMRQVSSAFSALTHSRSLWLDLLRRYIISQGIPIPGLEQRIQPDSAASIDSLDASAIERCIRRALRLRRAWTSPEPTPTRHVTVHVPDDSESLGADHGDLWRIVSLRFCGRYILSVSYTSGMAPGGERMPLVFRSWDLQEEPRCVSRMEVPFRSGFTWNKAKRQGEQYVVLAIVPALADNFETQFFALGDDGSFRLKCTNSSHGPLRALHGSTVLARHETDHLSLRDYNIDEPRCLIMNPHIVQPEDYLTSHLQGRHLFVIWARRLTIYGLSEMPAVKPDGQPPVLEPLATCRWPWPIDSARLASQSTSGLTTFNGVPAIHIFLRFSSFLPWPVNMLHHYLLSPSLADPRQPYAMPPQARVTIPSHVRLFSVGDIALGAHDMAVWIDNSTEDETGKRLAGALLKVPRDDEPESDVQITTFDRTPMRAAEPWVNVEVDDREGRIAVGSLGSFELYEYV